MGRRVWGEGVPITRDRDPEIKPPTPNPAQKSRDLQPGPGGQGSGIRASEADPRAGGGDVEEAGEREAGGDHIGQPGFKGSLVGHRWNL